MAMPCVKHLIMTYLKNREEFYAVMLQRIPHEALRKRLADAVHPISVEKSMVTALDELEMVEADEFLAELGLYDALKKPAYGQALGRTTISVEEAVARSESMEQTGAVMFEHLSASFPSLVSIFLNLLQERKQSLAAMLRLDDELRYHRFSP